MNRARTRTLDAESIGIGIGGVDARRDVRVGGETRRARGIVHRAFVGRTRERGGARGGGERELERDEDELERGELERAQRAKVQGVSMGSGRRGRSEV